MRTIQYDRSFIATLRYLNWPGAFSLVMAYNDGGVAGGGWLILPGNSYSSSMHTVRLRFDLVRRDGQGGYYKVKCVSEEGGYAGTYLDTSRNGYLGLYGSVAQDRLWKVEAAGNHVVHGDLGEEDELPAFHLRGPDNELVRLPSTEKPAYLSTAGNDKPVLFTVEYYEAV